MLLKFNVIVLSPETHYTPVMMQRTEYNSCIHVVDHVNTALFVAVGVGSKDLDYIAETSAAR